FSSRKDLLFNCLVFGGNYTWHNHRGKCSTCARDIIEELPYAPEKNDGPDDNPFKTVDELRKKLQDTIRSIPPVAYQQNPRVRVKYQPDWKTQAQAVAVWVGLLCGIAWAIDNDKARWRFFWSSFGGVSVGWIVHLTTGNASVSWAFIVLGLFVGIVSALASVGAYGKK
ncbi:MAG: hypothetical protein OXT74_06475, partial [Candidatus Poribacteria bacterium]|nr:hypothetical protein [Candidatus Poribacteria bacterium]